MEDCHNNGIFDHVTPTAIKTAPPTLVILMSTAMAFRMNATPTLVA